MKKRTIISFCILVFLLITLFFISVNSGSVKVTYKELFNGLFISYNEQVDIIYDLRFPRIIIAMLAGSALAISGVLFQAVLKNPLADPGILGISSGANFVSVIILAFFPQLFFFTPVFAFIGGIITCIIVYTLAWKSGFTPLRIILVGVAINSMLIGLLQCFKGMGGRSSGAASIVSSSISMKTWSDVRMLSIYVVIGIILAMCVTRVCNLLALEDKTVRSLGKNVDALRIIVSIIAVLLASITTAVVGTISFIGLIVPHIARLIVGNDHKVLVSFSALLGAFTMLLADTVGRLVTYPYEISAGVIMAVIGGPFFVLLLKRSDNAYGG